MWSSGWWHLEDSGSKSEKVALSRLPEVGSPRAARSVRRPSVAPLTNLSLSLSLLLNEPLCEKTFSLVSVAEWFYFWTPGLFSVESSDIFYSQSIDPSPFPLTPQA